MNLAMRGITKSFGANDVLKGIDFDLEGGQIVALLGENGAGKSTLMNILGGVLPADSGSISLDGRQVVFRTPMESLTSGIAFIHQELNLVNDLAVYENMFIGRELKKHGCLLNSRTMCEKCSEIFQRMDVNLDPRTMVRDLDTSYKQIVEIARALLMDASIIIMDEPTTSLTDPEIQRVFDMMHTLQGQGVAIVFISHKLREVMEICTDYTVLRDGSVVARGKVSDTNVDELARCMVGHDVRTESLRKDRKLGETVLEVRGLTNGNSFKNINFSVRAGEILGFTGLLGDGRSELFQTIFGNGGKYTGEILVSGVPVHIQNTRKAMSLGIGYVPRNRKENGIIADMNILENGSIITWPKNRRGMILDWNRIGKEFSKQVENLKIKMDDKRDPIGSLSGGNQQKVVLAKWLNAEPKVLIFDNPTQGVDVGAKEDIYDIILALAAQGVAIVVLSSEAQEIIRLCDRTIVLYHGSMQGELKSDKMTEQGFMRLATGGEMKERAVV